MSEFSIPVRVYIEDTDAGGIVYYANYLRYLERARTDWLRELGVDLREWHIQGHCLFVVHEVTLKYRRPAVYNDLLTVTSTLSKARRASLGLVQQVRRSAELLVDGRVELACVTADSMKPTPIPQPILEAISCGH